VATIKGGDKLESALRDLARRVARPATLRVGFLEGATYPNGMSVPMVAALNEFGTSRAPPRPFFRNMVSAKSREWPAALTKLLQASDYDAVTALQLAGQAIKGQLQQSINEFVSPPLAASTIKRKGFDKPLIDTGVMVNSVDYEVQT
jgi:hypothetical protein